MTAVAPSPSSSPSALPVPPPSRRDRAGDRPGSSVRVGHATVVVVAGLLGAGASAVVAFGLSLCGLAGGRCEPEELAATDRATTGAVLTAIVTLVLVALAARSARWGATGAAAVQVLALGVAFGASAALAGSGSAWADVVALSAFLPVPLLFRSGLLSGPD